MNLIFSQKSIVLAYYHGHFTKTLRYKSLFGLGDVFLIPHEHPLRGDLLLLILIWENLIYHSNFNRKLKTHFLPPNDPFQKVSTPGCYILDTYRLDTTFGQS